MNQKGDITVTIFVIGVIALCFFALISFYISNLDTSDNFKNIQLIEKVNNKIESNDPGYGMIAGKKRYMEVSYESGWFVEDELKVLFEVAYLFD